MPTGEPTGNRSPLPRYLAAALVVLLMAALRAAVEPWLGDRAPFLPFVPAILAAALWCGLGPAILATLLSFVLVHGFAGARQPGMGDRLEGLLFLFVAAGVVLLGEIVNRSRRRIAEAERLNRLRTHDAEELAEELNLLIDGAQGHAICMLDATGRVTIWNRGAERLLGWSEAEARSLPLSAFYPPDAIAAGEPERDLARAATEGRIMREDWRLRKDGSRFLAAIALTALFTGEGRLRGFAGFIRDLTEQRHTEEQLQALQSELIHVARVSAMGTMASTLAHELNQPITAIANYVEAVRDQLADPRPAEFPAMRGALDETAREAMRAGQIVRRLRDFVARGDVEKTIEPLPDLIHEAAVLGLMGTREKGIEAVFDLAPGDASVLVDKVQIQQVLINLIRNGCEAMGSTPERRLVIASRPDRPGFVRVTVTDTGAGIAPEVAKQLFRAFVSTKSEGMGLGLSICRTIVEANGGRIWMEPRQGGGTHFHFTLARAQTEERHGGQEARSHCRR